VLKARPRPAVTRATLDRLENSPRAMQALRGAASEVFFTYLHKMLALAKTTVLQGVYAAAECELSLPC
jgi:hypothetical protein